MDLFDNADGSAIIFVLEAETPRSVATARKILVLYSLDVWLPCLHPIL